MLSDGALGVGRIHSKHRRAHQVKAGRLVESERRASAPAHFKSPSVIRKEPENSETKRLHYKGAIILSAGECAGQATAGGVRGSALMSASQHLLLPVISGWQLPSTFPFVEAIVESFLIAEPSVAPPVTLHLHYSQHPSGSFWPWLSGRGSSSLSSLPSPHTHSEVKRPD